MDTGLKRELIQALGTRWLAKGAKGYPKNFSPNNIKSLIITSQGVIIQYHISVNGQPLIKYNEVRTQDQGVGMSPRFINTILKARVMGCLEELYIEDALIYAGYADLTELQYLLTKNRSTTEQDSYRLRFMGSIVAGTDLKMIMKMCSQKTGLSCLAANPIIQPCLNITFASPNNQGDKYIKYYNLVPQSYYLDRADGELERHFKAQINKVLDIQFESGIKALIKKDIDNLDKVHYINSFRTSPTTEGSRAIRNTITEVFTKLYNNYGLAEDYLDKLLNDMSVSQPEVIKQVYRDYGVTGNYNRGEKINRRKVMELLSQKQNQGMLQLPKLIGLTLTSLKKTFPDKNIKVESSFSENMKELKRVSTFDKPKEKKKDSGEFDPRDFVDPRALEEVRQMYREMGVDLDDFD